MRAQGSTVAATVLAISKMVALSAVAWKATVESNATSPRLIHLTAQALVVFPGSLRSLTTVEPSCAQLTLCAMGCQRISELTVLPGYIASVILKGASGG